MLNAVLHGHARQRMAHTGDAPLATPSGSTARLFGTISQPGWRQRHHCLWSGAGQRRRPLPSSWPASKRHRRLNCRGTHLRRSSRRRGSPCYASRTLGGRRTGVALRVAFTCHSRRYSCSANRQPRTSFEGSRTPRARVCTPTRVPVQLRALRPRFPASPSARRWLPACSSIQLDRLPAGVDTKVGIDPPADPPAASLATPQSASLGSPVRITIESTPWIARVST